MPSLLKDLHTAFDTAISKAFPDNENIKNASLELCESTNEKFGHYQFNSAMKMAKELSQPPRKIAEKIIEHTKLTTNDEKPFIQTLEIAGPGFINITLTAEYLANNIYSSLHDPHLGTTQEKKRIIIDFSSPNTAKEMHVGHLRSTIIGDCLARIFEFSGNDVLRLNHIGDWGTSFGMLIAYMKLHAANVLSGEENTDLTHLVTWYKASKQLFDNDEEFKKTSQLEVVQLQNGDVEALKAWNIICEISRKAYQEIYDLLDIRILERGESYYNPQLKNIVADLEKKGLVTLSDGAKCIFLEGFKNREGNPLPLMVQKSDGGYNYDTTDMAAIHQRVEEEKADRIIYVTDAGQATHFDMIFAAAIKAGYLDLNKTRVDHVGFGLVLGNDGKKFRTRSGDTEKLVDLLNTAVEQAEEIVKQRSPDMNEKEQKSLSKILGLAAVKYADLSCHRTSNYTFSYDRMLRFEGNTAPFILYSYVRIAGIKRKALNDEKQHISTAEIILRHPSEIALGLHLNKFDDVLTAIREELLPHRLTDYLYELANKFNAFFRDCRVEGSPEQASRLQLCEATARTLKCGLNLIGIQTVERM